MSNKSAGAVPGKHDRSSGLVPKLRFPDFQHAPGWEIQPLKRLAKRRNRQNVGCTVDRVLTNSAEHGVVDQRDYFEKDIANPGNLEGYFIIERGDYVYNPRVSSIAPVGPIHRNEIGLGVMSPLYTVFSFENTQNDFYAHYFKTPYWHSYLYQVSNSGARHDRMAISAAAFINMPVPVSDPLEQQKIADCLSSIDALIASEAGKLKALKDHKRGLMQQLFPARGGATPRLRFPEFQNAGEWGEVELGTIAEVKLGKMLDKNKNVSGHLFPYLNNAAVRWNRIDLSDLPKMYFSGKELDRFGLKAGDVVVCEGGEPGRAAVWDGRMPELKFQKAIHRVRFNVPFEPIFLVHYLESLAGTTRFEMLFTGGGIQHLTRETFLKLKVPLIDLSEQQRIAGCLSSINVLLAALHDKIETFRAHKTGLIHQLFPAFDEIEE